MPDKRRWATVDDIVKKHGDDLKATFRFHLNDKLLSNSIILVSPVQPITTNLELTSNGVKMIALVDMPDALKRVALITNVGLPPTAKDDSE